MFEGFGVYLYSSGERFEGQLKSGQKHGKGVYYYENGNQYDGEWINDLKEGNGTFFFAKYGEKYVGDFK